MKTKAEVKAQVTNCRECSVILVRGENWCKSFYTRGAKLCSPCNQKKTATKHKTDPEWSYSYSRKQQLKKTYGITIEEYESLYANQNGLCLICGTKMAAHKSDDFYTACVDHNHTTNEIRGLLCIGCNRGIGYLGDNPKLLRKAAGYLEDKGYSPYEKRNKIRVKAEA